MLQNSDYRMLFRYTVLILKAINSIEKLWKSFSLLFNITRDILANVSGVLFLHATRLIKNIKINSFLEKIVHYYLIRNNKN